MCNASSVKIDVEWFRERIKESSYGGQIPFAKAMSKRLGYKVDQSALSRIFREERKMQIEEVFVMAELLGENPLTILERLGLHIDPKWLRK